MKAASNKLIGTQQRTPQRAKKQIAEPDSPKTPTKIESLMNEDVDPAKVLLWIRDQESLFFDDNSYELLSKCLELFQGKDVKLTNYSILLKKGEQIVFGDDEVTHDLLALFTMRKLMTCAKPKELLLFLSELSENLSHAKTVFCLEFVLCLMNERAEECERSIQVAFDLIYYLLSKLIQKFAKLDSKLKAVLFSADLSKSLLINKGEWQDLNDYINHVLSKKLFEMLTNFTEKNSASPSLMDISKSQANLDQSSITGSNAINMALFDYDEFIECTPKNPNNIKLKTEPPISHFISVLLTKLIGFIRTEDNLFRGEENAFHHFIPHMVEKFKILNSNTMVNINNFKILLKLKKDYSNFYRHNKRLFYHIEGVILII